MKLLACINLRDEEAENVVDKAGRWAARAGARVDVLFVDEVVPVPAWVSDPLSAQLLAARWDEVRAEEDRRLVRLSELLPADRRGTAVRVEGRVVDEILDRATGYDGVVLASRRHSALGRLLVGSVAARVARLSPAAVLVVPSGAPASTEATGRIRALFGVDLRAEDADHALPHAIEWAVRFGAKLDLAHIDDANQHVPYILDPDVRARFEAEWQEMRRRDLARLEELLARIPAENRGQPRLDDGDPADALRDLSREYDLLMVATHGRRGLSRLMLGSVAEKAIQACERPVLLLRMPENAS